MLHAWGEERRLQGLVGMTEGKRPLGRPRRNWKDYLKMEEMGIDGEN
jgi:hypothetical protein